MNLENALLVLFHGANRPVKPFEGRLFLRVSDGLKVNRFIADLGTDARFSCRSGGASITCAERIACAARPVKGGAPESIS